MAGFASNRIPTINSEEVLEKGFSILGVNLEQYRLKKKQIYKSAVNDIIEMHGEGLIRPLQPIVYSLDNVNDAINALGERRSFSKVVVGVR